MKNKKIVLFIIISFIITCFFTKRISAHITKNILHAVYVLIEKENDATLKEAFAAKKELAIKSDDLINIIINNNDEIVEVTFNLEKSEKIMNYITSKLSNNKDDITKDGYILKIPTGSIFNWPLISNLGPKIPVKIELANMAIGNIRTEIKEYGINNALVEIYVDIDVKTAPILLSNAKVNTKKYTFLLSSKIIAGKVPDFYNGRINRESVLFNLPVS